MRLSEKEKKTILECVKEIDPQAEVFIHGSRALDHLQGGDIDLLVVSEKMGIIEKAKILAAIKESLGDQKIDLKICNQNEKETDPFVSLILKKSQPLV